MTKLFSMKSLAFAGAAAFAMALIPAPQADAATAPKKVTVEIDYANQTLKINNANGTLDGTTETDGLLNTADGVSIYYAYSKKSADDAKKYTLIAAEETTSGVGAALTSTALHK